MERFDVDTLEENIKDWFVDNFDLDDTCLKIKTDVDEEEDSPTVKVTVEYKSGDWPTACSDESMSEEDTFTAIENAIESEMSNVMFNSEIEYDSVEMSHDSSFKWNALIKGKLNEEASDSDSDSDDEDLFKDM